ncbi:unnamed protein product [Rhizophagus irregularis]|nr:unnamed protein product [Rhizophagus irregularis]CAB5378586.1 unnamed protein product [Rhizophagus irregularis]
MSSNPFDTNASDYDKIPFCLTVAKNCSKAIIDELGNELNPEKTEVIDFACGTGLISQELRSYVKSIVGIDMAQGMVDEYNKKVLQQGIDENEMKAICLELKEGDQLNGRKFDLVVCASAYHHIDDVTAISRILASYLKPSGKLIVLDLIKDPATKDKLHEGFTDHHHGHHHGHHEDSTAHKEDHEDVINKFAGTVVHRGGFYPEEIEKIFLDTGVLEDVKVEIAFTFNKFIKQDQKEYTFKYLIAKGKKKE